MTLAVWEVLLLAATPVAVSLLCAYLQERRQ